MFNWFDLNPHHLANAALQQWIMLLVAGTLGFILGYVSRKRLLVQLEGELAGIDQALADCYQSSPAQPATFTDEDVVLRRVMARSGELDLTRIGTAPASEADDLQAIGGVGPFLERKLNALGLYTFRQMARLTPEDVEKVNEIIEFFPGRIERDNWVGQAAELARQT